MFAVTNQLRTSGTDHLLAAAVAAGARRFIAQSYTGWTNPREGGPVKTEEDPLDPSPPAAQRESLAAIGYLERAVTCGRADGRDRAEVRLLLRARRLRHAGRAGPQAEGCRSSANGAGIWSFLHIQRRRARRPSRALERGAPGVYNVVDDEPASVAEWLPFLAAGGRGEGALPGAAVARAAGRGGDGSVR